MITTIQLEKAITRQQYNKIVDLLKNMDIPVKKEKKEAHKEKEKKAFLYNSQKNASKIFSKYL